MIDFQIETNGNMKYLVMELPENVMCDTLGIGMLQNNDIPGLLPVVKENDHISNYLTYQIASYYVPLAQELLVPMNRKAFLTIIKKVLETALLLEDYMMEPGFLLLSPEYIYYNKEKLDIKLIYYPLLMNAHEFQVKNFVKEMIMNMEFNTSEDNTYIAKIINILNSKSVIAIEEVLEEIHSLIALTPATEYKMSDMQPIYPEKKQENLVSNIDFEDTPTLVLNHLDEDFVPEKKEDKPEHSQIPNRNMSSARNNIKIPSLKPVALEIGEVDDEIEYAEEPVKKRWSLFGKREKKENKDEEKNISISSSLPEPMQIQRRYVEDETVVLGMPMVADSEETTQLYQDEHIPTIRATLIKRNTREKINISKDIFKVGKEKSKVDYCIINNTAVSRTHADIIYQQERFFIMDNNSLNHTFVNGEQIPSNQPVPLIDHAIICFANEEFEFIVSS